MSGVIITMGLVILALAVMLKSTINRINTDAALIEELIDIIKELEQTVDAQNAVLEKKRIKQ
jgi:hypothetical protein